MSPSKTDLINAIDLLREQDRTVSVALIAAELGCTQTIVRAALKQHLGVNQYLLNVRAEMRHERRQRYRHQEQEAIEEGTFAHYREPGNVGGKVLRVGSSKTARYPRTGNVGRK